MEHNKVSSNPARLLKSLRESERRVRFLNHHAPDEETRLRKVISEFVPDRRPEPMAGPKHALVFAAASTEKRTGTKPKDDADAFDLNSML
jgi:hypothetical protein